MPGDSGVLVVTRVRSTTTKCTRGRGCNGHPAFPTPSFRANDKCKPRAHRAARMRGCVWNRDVDANTHSSWPGLTRASISLRKNIFEEDGKKMDCRVEPGNDGMN